MMKCDMCTDRTSEGLQADVRLGLPERGAVVRHRRGVPPAAGAGSLLRDFAVRPPGGAHQGPTPWSTTAAGGPIDVLGPAATEWLDDPFGLEEAEAGEPSPTPTPIWRRDFPYEAAGEEEVTRREFARYLVLGAGAIAAGNVGLAAWTQLRSINTGEPRAIVALDEVAVGDDLPVPLPARRRPGDPAARRRPARSSRSARSARTSAASSTTRPRRTGGTAPATRATSTRSPAPCCPGRRHGRSAASTSRSATTGRLGARAAGMRVSERRPPHVVGGARVRHRARRPAGLPRHGRRRGVPGRRRRRWRGRRPACRSSWRRRGRLPPLPPAVTATRPSPAHVADRHAVPGLLRHGDGDGHRRHRRRPAGPRLAGRGAVRHRRRRLRRARRARWSLRVVRYWPAFAADLTNHAKGFAFLTTVAGTNVLGSASGVIHGWWGLAWVLWWVEPRPLGGVRCTPR